MATIKLNGTNSGFVQLVANTAAQNNTLTLPNVNDTLANITSPTFYSTNSGVAMVIDANGNMGIGTSIPAYLLDVNGSARIGGSTSNSNQNFYINAGIQSQTTANWNFSNVNFIRNSSNTQNPRFIGMLLDGDSINSTTIGAYNAIWGSYNANPTTGSTSASLQGAMVYGAYYGHRWVLNGTEAMRIDASGNVGIGISSPSTYGKLAVSGNMYAGDTTSTADGTITIGSNGAGSVAITRTGTGLTNSAMTFSTTYATLQERMRITSTGNVGIGSAAPQQTLDVQGNVNVLNTVIMGSSFLRNRIINGSMQVAQYGTSVAPTVSNFTYSMDRFFCAINSGTSGYTVTQLSQANTGLSGFYNALRYQRNSGQTNTTTMAFGQTIETANCYDLAGQTVTLSFWARAGSNFSAASSQITARIATGTGVDQGSAGAYNGTWTGYAQTNTVVTISTSWVRYSIAVTIPAGVNEIQILFYWAGVGTAGTNDYADFTGIQFEAGPVATPFERRLYGAEYDLCRRYCEVYGPAIGEATGTFPQQLAQIDVNNRAETFISYYPKRVVPTITFASGTNMFFQTMANTGIAITGYSGTLVGTGLNTSNLFFTVASGITTNSLSAIGYIFLTSSNQVVISAEL